MNLLSITTKTSALAALVMSLTLPTLSAQANRRDRGLDRTNRVVTFELNQMQVRELNQTGRLGLRRAIRESGRALPHNPKLLDVEVVGRATGPQSRISLLIDGDVVDRAFLKQIRRPRRDRSRRPGGNPLASAILINHSPRISDGPWRITTEQDVRARKVIISVRDARRDRPRRKISLGSKKATKFIGRNTNFTVNRHGVISVSVKANSNDLDVSQVSVHYKDGDYEILRGLHGYLRHGKTTTAFLAKRHKKVSHINIEGHSPNSFGSTARIEVLIGVENTRPRPRR